MPTNDDRKRIQGLLKKLFDESSGNGKNTVYFRHVKHMTSSKSRNSYIFLIATNGGVEDITQSTAIVLSYMTNRSGGIHTEPCATVAKLSEMLYGDPRVLRQVRM